MGLIGIYWNLMRFYGDIEYHTWRCRTGVEQWRYGPYNGYIDPVIFGVAPTNFGVFKV
jgi:hypothetical protein